MWEKRYYHNLFYKRRTSGNESWAYTIKTGKYSYVLTSVTNNRRSRHKNNENCTY